MSSLRNSVQRRSHRERAQPLERQRLGLLEKKKDYQKRAKDYNKKKAVLKSLRQKAADRNEDEFYYGMMSRKGPGASLTRGKAYTGNVDGDRGNKAMDVDTVRLLKTQDLGYIRTMRNVAAKEVRALEERFVLAGGTEQGDGDDDDDGDDDMGTSASAPQKPKKIVFFDGVEEREQALEQAEDEDEAMEDSEEDGQKAKAARRKAQNFEKLELNLKAARKKLKALRDAEYELEVQKAKMAKTATSGGTTKNGRRLKVRERKR
ncbi:small-subunit processome [Chaetomidium leptoderma]|uniref:U3 small nucleolar RNA-associated protein 11 n=1 Tax=Chaetomidium leptoderma TaxID=669021 RepID=A0AAN6ZUC0_9PEZI|nr:small-subunit processome [Chaetomidium leptoderma]